MTKNYVEAIILAGGKGTRLKSILDDRPKPMAIIEGKPFIEWVLFMLRHQGIQRAIICTGYLGEIIECHLGNGRHIGMKIAYARDPFPLGTGGAVRNALDKTDSTSLLVINGDTYFHPNISNILKTHFERTARVSLSLVRVDDSSRYGSVKINKDGEVMAFVEKSPRKESGLINAGIYIMERNVVNEIPEGAMISLEREILPNLIGKGLYGVSCEGPFVDIGVPESINEAGTILKEEFEYLLQEVNL